MRADAHGAKADLHVSQNLAFEPVHRDDRDRKPDKNQQHVHRGPKEISSRSRSFVASNVGQDVLDEVVHQRSTSPRTMSSVPITAMTSATSCPRHIRSSAWRLTKLGGRTRTRYGCVDPSLTMKYPSSPLGASIEWYTSPTGGFITFGTFAMIGPSGIAPIACSMIRSDCRISAMRTMYRS